MLAFLIVLVVHFVFVFLLAIILRNDINLNAWPGVRNLLKVIFWEVALLCIFVLDILSLIVGCVVSYKYKNLKQFETCSGQLKLINESKDEGGNQSYICQECGQSFCFDSMSGQIEIVGHSKETADWKKFAESFWYRLLMKLT